MAALLVGVVNYQIKALYKAFDMEALGWNLIDPGSAAGLDGSIAKHLSKVKTGLVTTGTQLL